MGASQRARTRPVHEMYALAVTALLALASAAHAQDTIVWVDTETATDEIEELHNRRHTPELRQVVDKAKDDVLFLYTQYSGQQGRRLRKFMRDMTGYANRTAASSLDSRVLESAPEVCRSELQKKLFKVEADSKLEASFSAVNHHKFILGHMIVFRMHLNKSDDYVRKCEKVLAHCGSCESTVKVKRWRELAEKEIRRVEDDLQHTRMSYEDLVTHQQRQLNKIHRHANSKAEQILQNFHACIRQ